jgi:hypothetical protein
LVEWRRGLPEQLLDSSSGGFLILHLKSKISGDFDTTKLSAIDHSFSDGDFGNEQLLILFM